jgi:YVTN family beta-propeller protein
MRRVGWYAAACLALVVAASPVETQAQQPRTYVLDTIAQTLTVMEIAGARVERTAKLEGSPTRLLRTLEGRWILVLDRGQGNDFGDEGFQAKTKSALTILDGSSLAVHARIDLGAGLEDELMLSSAGDRLSVMCPGYRGKKPADNLPRELVTVDLAGGKILSRLELPRPSPEFFATPDGGTVVVLSPVETPKKSAPLPAELRFVDTTTGTVTATIALDGDPRRPVLAPDGRFVYLLDRGKPSDNPDKNQNGRLHTVSMTSRAVTTVSDAGSKPRGLVLDEAGKRLFVLSDGPPVKGPANRDRPGELRVVRDGAVSQPIQVANAPERIQASADGKALYVLGVPGVTRLALPALEPSPTIKAPGMSGEETAISADGRRGWVSYGEYFTTYDLEAGVQMAQVRTGRMGKKMFLALESGLHTETSRLEAENLARKEGRSQYSYTEYSVTAPTGTMAVRPDGKEVYALNSQTSDLTIIDAQSGQVIEKVAAGGSVVRFMPSVSVALVVSKTTVHVVDLNSHQKRPNIVTDSPAGFVWAELSPDARLAVIHGPRGILFVNASSGTPVGTMVPGKGIADVVIDWAGRP